jgi:hypothetical protein
MYVPPLGYKREGTHTHTVLVDRLPEQTPWKTLGHIDSHATQLTEDVGYYVPLA